MYLLLPVRQMGNTLSLVHEIKLSASGMLPREKTFISIVVTTNVSFLRPGLLETEHISPLVILVALCRFGRHLLVTPSLAIMAIPASCAVLHGPPAANISPRAEITVIAQCRYGGLLREIASIYMIVSTGYFLLPGRLALLHPRSCRQTGLPRAVLMAACRCGRFP